MAIRISFRFTEYAVSERGYDEDNEASSSDSSDDGNQGNVRDMWDWLLLVYYLTSLKMSSSFIHPCRAFRYWFDLIWFDQQTKNTPPTSPNEMLEECC